MKNIWPYSYYGANLCYTNDVILILGNCIEAVIKELNEIYNEEGRGIEVDDAYKDLEMY